MSAFYDKNFKLRTCWSSITNFAMLSEKNRTVENYFFAYLSYFDVKYFKKSFKVSSMQI